MLSRPPGRFCPDIGNHADRNAVNVNPGTEKLEMSGVAIAGNIGLTKSAVKKEVAGRICLGPLSDV